MLLFIKNAFIFFNEINGKKTQVKQRKEPQELKKFELTVNGQQP